MIRILLVLLIGTLGGAGLVSSVHIKENAPAILTSKIDAKVEGMSEATIVCLTGLAFVQTKDNLRQVVNPDGSGVTCTSI